MVLDRTLVIKNLQQEIELRKQGIMMVVCLVNKDELNILLDDPAKVIERFYTIVDIACQESIEYSIIKDFEPTKFLHLLTPIFEPLHLFYRVKVQAPQ